MEEKNISAAGSTSGVVETGTDGKTQAGAGEKKPPVINTGKLNKETGVYVHVFKKPFEFEGNKYEEIAFNFGCLTGGDCIAIDDEISMEGRYVIDPTISVVFLGKMAARASDPKIGFDALEAMAMPDFVKIKNAARDYMVSMGF